MDDDYDDADEGDETPRPLDREEAARVRRDLDDLSAFRHTFEPEGYKGVSVFCDDCAEEHFYGWQMLTENLTALLQSGETPVHEPAFDPRPDEYVDWQYAQGYLDGMGDAGADTLPSPLTETGGCPYCGVELPGGGAKHAYCPTCGLHLGPARMARALLDRGWPDGDVADLLRGARIPPLRTLPARGRGREGGREGGRAHGGGAASEEGS